MKAAAGQSFDELAETLARLTPIERDAFEERAAILEFEAGFGRGQAEARALAYIADARRAKRGAQ